MMIEMSESIVLPELTVLGYDQHAPTQWDSVDGRRALADYLASVNDGVSVRGKPGLFGRVQRLLRPEHPVSAGIDTVKLP